MNNNFTIYYYVTGGLAAILFSTLIWRYYKKRTPSSENVNKRALFQEYKDNDVDMNNLIESINKSKSLHKVLSKKYHPDKYLNQSTKMKAEELMKEINRNKTDYKKLLDLEDKAIKNLTNKI